MYSLKKPEEIEHKGAPPPTPPASKDQPVRSWRREVPELWFNPRTNRWISKSCRLYREMIRDRALVGKGLQPGPKKQFRQKRRVETAPYIPPQQWIPTHAEIPPPTPPPPTQSQPTEEEVMIQKRDALWTRYGF